MRNRHGFTLIELLVVVSIVGLLASLALPRYQYVKQRAHVTAMVSDLRNLMLAEEGFYANNGDYAGGIVTGPEVPGTGGAGRVSMRTSEGVQVVLTYYNSAGEGWSAVATHPGVTIAATDECGVFVGDVSYSPNSKVVSPGQIACY
jgi:prepilin-type N-terminal cleavage/methylation domain-containing protein